MRKVSLIVILLLITLITNGCFKRDTMEDIDIYTTAYPIEYIVSILYKEHAQINSIYPNDVNINQYTLTEKQIRDYSKAHLFIYNGLSKEIDYALDLINTNQNIKIIDAAMGMEYTNYVEEIWLDPANLLMLAQNIRNGFHEYIENPYLKKEIDDNYDYLKLTISELDAEMKDIVSDAKYKTIVVGSDLLKFLEKYNLNVISLEENEELTAKTINDVTTMIQNEEIKYIYLINNEKPNNTINNLLKDNKLELLSIHSISNLNEKQRENKEDYITLIKANIELIKKELYK